MLVFVYGTLTDRDRVDAVLAERRGHAGRRSGETGGSGGASSDPAPRAAEFRGPATLEGCHRVDGRYPTLAPGGSVEGRLLSVGTDALGTLDEYEGVDDGLYVRVAVPLADDDRSAWTYVGDPAKLGVGESVTWPHGTTASESELERPGTAEKTFEERVRRYLAERCVVRPTG